MSLLQLLKGIDNVQKCLIHNIQHFLSSSALKFKHINKYVLIKYYIFSICELYARVQLV
jgi:hypothetical protein